MSSVFSCPLSRNTNCRFFRMLCSFAYQTTERDIPCRFPIDPYLKQYTHMILQGLKIVVYNHMELPKPRVSK